MGWTRTGHTAWSDRIQPLNLTAGSQFDAVFRLTENKHPHYGGLELHLLDLAPANR
jgi:single-stranded-DNA-specific exonuclease